jgi:hypothetical protein
MIFRKRALVGFVVLLVALIAITLSSCASFTSAFAAAYEEAINNPSPGFGLRNDAQNGENMSVRFTTSLYADFVFECSYRGNRRPDTLLLRIDDNSPIILKISHINAVSPGLIEFAISDDQINQLLNSNKSINLEFNNVYQLNRNWDISSSIMEIKNFITYYKEKKQQ